MWFEFANVDDIDGDDDDDDDVGCDYDDGGGEIDEHKRFWGGFQFYNWKAAAAMMTETMMDPANEPAPLQLSASQQ